MVAVLWEVGSFSGMIVSPNCPLALCMTLFFSIQPMSFEQCDGDNKGESFDPVHGPKELVLAMAETKHDTIFWHQ